MFALGGVCSQGVSAPGGVPGGDTPGTATAAGGTHPTGIFMIISTAVHGKPHRSEAIMNKCV